MAKKMETTIWGLGFGLNNDHRSIFQNHHYVVAFDVPKTLSYLFFALALWMADSIPCKATCNPL